MTQVLLQEAIIWAVIWLLLGVGAAIIAHNKGRSFVLWLIIGTLGGFIALIVVAALPSIDQHPGRSRDYRKCPYCAELVRREAIRCRHCQADITPLLPEPIGEEPVSVPFYYMLDPSILAGLAVGGLLVGWWVWRMLGD